LAARQKYLLGPGGEPIGTATAWFDAPQSGEEIGVGRVHWVAIVPEFQGRGLAKPLLDSVLQMLRVCGHTRAVLLTDTRRPAAIALYEKFGFRGV
jgi:ribosomal protein S18 acetylase RimI-like enzyme